VDFLTQAERNLMGQDILDIVNDPQIQGTVLYKSYVGAGQFDPVTGSILASFAGTWINIVRRRLDETEDELGLVVSGVKPGGAEARFQIGQFRYLIPAVTIGVIKKDDRIVDGGKEQYVISYQTDALGIYHAVTVRNLSNR
jgi:hypothetical protein